MQQSFWLGLDFSTTKIETTLQIYQISKHDKFGLREPREQSLYVCYLSCPDERLWPTQK